MNGLPRGVGVLAVCAALLACESSRAPGNTVGATASSSPLYEKITVKDPQQSAAFLAVDDLDGDGIKEIVLSTLIEQSPPGPPSALSRGALRIFRTAGGVEGPWTEQVVIATTSLPGFPFINTPQVLDIDGDGVKDLLVQTGFLTTLGGAHFWLKGPDYETPNYFSLQTSPITSDNYFWHESAQTDLDGDGLLDIVTTSAKTQDLINNPGNPLGSPGPMTKLKVEWYRNLGNGEFAYHLIAPDLGGVFLKLHDVDGDGDQDILLTHFFGPPALRDSLVWMEQTARPDPSNNYAGSWVTHRIDNSIGLGYHMELADLNGDGRIDLIVDSHNHQDNPALVDENGKQIPLGIYWFEIPDDPRNSTQWVKHVISENFAVSLAGSPTSQGVPGIFSVGDIDGDGRLDLAVPGDGNDKLYAFRQQADGSFIEDIIEDGEKMIAMAVIADIDGDGRNEIVAAKHNSNDGGTSLPPGFLRIYRYRPQ
jgi:hypothetical protein